MKMLNKIEASTTPRWDMMVELAKMQRNLDRMYDELMYEHDGSKEELEGMRGAISNLEYLKIKINNKRDRELNA